LREQVGQGGNAAPPLTLGHRLDGDAIEVVIQDRGALLGERRRAVVLFLPDDPVAIDACAAQTLGERAAERFQMYEGIARELLRQLAQLLRPGAGADQIVSHHGLPREMGGGQAGHGPSWPSPASGHKMACRQVMASAQQLFRRDP
jgi:hypothetical protein